MLASDFLKLFKVVAETIKCSILVEIRMGTLSKLLKRFELFFECLATCYEFIYTRSKFLFSDSLFLFSGSLCFLAVVVGTVSSQGSYDESKHDDCLAQCL